MARPTKYKKEFCEMLIEHMTEGLSFESFGAVISVANKTLHDWKNTIPEFNDAYLLASDRCRKFYEVAGRDGMSGKIPGFIAAVWIFNMKNRFHWRDRQEIDHKSSDGTMSPHELIEIPDEDLLKIQKLLSKSDKKKKKDENPDA